MPRDCAAANLRAPMGAAILALLRVLPPQGRRMLALLAALQVTERGALVAIAVSFARYGTVLRALPASLTLVGLFMARRAVGASAVRASKAALAQAVVDRLLSTEALEPVPADSDEAVAATFDALFAAQQIVAQHFPAVVADIVSAMAIAVGMFLSVPPNAHRLIGIAFAVLAVASMVVGSAYSLTTRLAQASTLAFGAVYEDLVIALGGRLELVSAGRDEEFRATVHEHLARWRGIAARGDATSALAGRAPIAAASLGIGVVFWFDASLRELVGSVGIGNAAVAASIAPPFLGVVRNLLLLAKDTVRARPLVAMLRAPDGPIGGPAGSAIPLLPAGIQWKSVSFRYGLNKKEQQPLALDDVSVDWPAGAVLVLAGPNGSGKSTLLRMLLGLAEPERGVVQVGETNLFAADLRAWRRQIAYLPQRPFLGTDAATVRGAVALIARSAADAEVSAALERVSLWSALARMNPRDPLAVPVRTLSSGQKQRLAVARTLCQRGKLVILDEPDANLDRQGIEMIAELVQELRSRSMVIIAAHTPELLAVGNLKVVLSDGHVELSTND